MKKNHICIARKSFFSCGVQRSPSSNCGYNYTFEVFIYGPIDPVTGLVINLTEVKKILNLITQRIDQKHLNYDLQLKSLDLPNIHQFIHDLFNKEFIISSPNNISLLKSKLCEGLSESSEIMTLKGSEVLKYH